MAVFFVAFALFLTWFIQDRAMGAQEDAVNLWSEKPELCWYGAIVIFAIAVLAAAVLGRPFISSSIIFVVALLLSYANEQKLALRGEPVLVDDMLMAGEADGLLNLVDINEFLEIATAAALVIVLGIVLNHVARKIWPYRKDHGYLRRHFVALRLIIATMAICGIAMTLQPFVNKGSHGDDTINIFGNDLKFIFFDQATNYENNGFLVGFVYGMTKMQIEEPKDYNEEVIAKIADKYEREKSHDNERKKLDEIVDNIIIILNESGYDPELLAEVYPHAGGDVIPNLRYISKNYPSGYMYSPEFGGGTANIEFEVFTGLSNYWTNTVPYVSLLPRMHEVPSVASFSKTSDFDTKAIHSYTGGLYNRSTALHKQGFDEFITIDQMSSKKHNSLSEYVNDWSAYYEVLNKIRESDKPQTVALITMQHHGAYDSAHYPNMNYMPESESYIAGQYYESLHNADEALGQFIDVLDASDEKTAVLWFGDHAAGVFMGVDHDKKVFDYLHMTPYFVYTNFDLGKTKLDLPTTSPNCLVNTMYNVLNVEKPTFDYLLDAVCEDNPILAVPYFSDFGPKETESYHDYELVNYDMLSGKQYWLKHTK